MMRDAFVVMDSGNCPAHEYDSVFCRQIRDLMYEKSTVPILVLTVADVLDRHPMLEPDEAMEVLKKMHRKWDVPWTETLDYYAGEMYPDKTSDPTDETEEP